MPVLSQREKSLFSVSFARKLPKTDHKTESIQLHVQKQFLHFCTSENARCYKTHTNTVQMKAEFSHDAISKDGTAREIKKKGGEDYKNSFVSPFSTEFICLVAFMLLNIQKEIQLKYSVEGKKQIFPG